MADPQQLMALMQRQGNASAQAPAPGATDSAPDANAVPPMASPMSTPEPKMGTREGALVNVSMAMDLLEQALPALGSESPEGQKLLAAIRSMSDLIGQKKAKADSLQHNEILQLLQSLPQAGGATPEGKAMQGVPPVPQMQGAGGGMPPGGPVPA